MNENEYRIMYRTADGVWTDFDTVSGHWIIFNEIGDAEVIVQHIVSMDGVIEGVVMDQNDQVVQQWKAAPYESTAELVEGSLTDIPRRQRN